jgi:type VI protein secretion system component VasF
MSRHDLEEFKESGEIEITSSDDDSSKAFSRKMKVFNVKQKEKLRKLYFLMLLTVILILVCVGFIVFALVIPNKTDAVRLAIIGAFQDLLIFIVGAWFGKISTIKNH